MSTTLIRLAGAVQLCVALGSLAVPVVLRWREDTARLTPLTRTVFWTYAGYIFTAHLAFAALSLGEPGLLTDGSPLARRVCGFIAAWWGARLALQFTAMDRSARPDVWWAPIAEACLIAAFAALTGAYGWVACS